MGGINSFCHREAMCDPFLPTQMKTAESSLGYGGMRLKCHHIQGLLGRDCKRNGLINKERRLGQDPTRCNGERAGSE